MTFGSDNIWRADLKRYVRVTSSILVLLLTPIFSTTSFAWNSRGHMMVAAIAYSKLNQQTRTRVDALLRLNPDRDNWLALIPEGTNAADKKKMLFMIAATWPDRIKSDPDYVSDGTHGGNRPPDDPTVAKRNTGYDDLNRHKYWHFVDTAFSTDNTPLPTLPTPNANTQIGVFRSVLASPTATKKLKSYDLCWLLHLVGDVHQPLHATTRVSASDPDGDDGGNGVLLESPSNLHTFWDDVVGGGSSKAPGPALTAIATLPTADQSKVDDLNVDHWITDSFEAAKTTVYKNPPIGDGEGPFTLTATYKANAKTLAQQQVALAGARLAKILNEELK